MLRITNVTRIESGYSVVIMTDRIGGRGRLYYLRSEESCAGAPELGPEQLTEHEVALWETRENSPLIAMVVVSVGAGGFLLACEIEPGPDTQWSPAFPIIEVVP